MMMAAVENNNFIPFFAIPCNERFAFLSSFQFPVVASGQWETFLLLFDPFSQMWAVGSNQKDHNSRQPDLVIF